VIAVLATVGVLAATAALVLAAVMIVPASKRVPLSRLDPTAAQPPTALADVTRRAVGIVDGVLVRRGTVSRLARTLQGAGLRLGPADFVLLVVAATAVSAALGLLVGGFLLAVPLGVTTVVLARVVVGLLASRRRAAFADQLDDSLQLMANSLRAGHSILRAVDSVAQEAPAPTSEEYAALINQTRMGRDLTEALDDLAGRMGSDDFSWVAQAIAIQREVGGNLAEVLDAVGHTIRERNAIRRQVKALSAEGKLSAIVLLALPPAVGGVLALIRPEYVAKFTESLMGYVLLAVAAVLMIIGTVWMRKTVQIKF
jgi:tight adherence protein B